MTHRSALFRLLSLWHVSSPSGHLLEHRDGWTSYIRVLSHRLRLVHVVKSTSDGLDLSVCFLTCYFLLFLLISELKGSCLYVPIVQNNRQFKPCSVFFMSLLWHHWLVQLPTRAAKIYPLFGNYYIILQLFWQSNHLFKFFFWRKKV